MFSDTMTLIGLIYALILTIILIGCSVYIIFIGVKHTRGIKKNIVYIDNVAALLADKIVKLNDRHNQELKKLNENIYMLQLTVKNIISLTEPYKPQEINQDYLNKKYQDNRKYVCEDTIERAEQNENLPFIEKTKIGYQEEAEKSIKYYKNDPTIKDFRNPTLGQLLGGPDENKI